MLLFLKLKNNFIMKKLENKLTVFFFAACGIIFLLMSCNNEDDICNCGTVISKSEFSREKDYALSLLIRNDCTSVKRKIYVTYEEYINTFINESFCATNKKTW